MAFRFQGTADSPTTPSRKSGAGHSLFSHLSTTPAGPPPTHLTNQSFTPADPPPRSVLGSSSYTAPNTFGKRGTTPGRPLGFAVPESSPPMERDEDDDADADADEDYEDDDDDHGAADMLPDQAPSPEKSAFLSSFMGSPRGLKRSRNGQVREPVESDYPGIARGITGRAAPAKLIEPDDMVLQEEDVLARLDTVAEAPPGDRDAALTERAAEITRLWRQHSGATSTREAGVGPESDDGLSKASYLAALLFQLHHPHVARSTPASRPQQQPRPSSRAIAKRSPANSCTVPRALLGWLQTYHNPFPDEFDPIWRTQPSPAAHERFWDCIFSCITRGKFDRAVRLLKDAGWENAATAADDRGSGDGYSDRQLDSIEEVVDRCIRVLQTCPALEYDDWDVKGPDWTLFRQRVRQAIKDLELFAGEEDDDVPVATEGNLFGRSSAMGMSTASRRVESKVPWSIYENLKLTYGILLGHTDEILDSSQDWLEASIYLTVWWDGEDEPVTAALNDSTSLRKSMLASQRTREVDLAPSAAYRQRLADAFIRATDSDDPLFLPDTMDPVHVGLACVAVDSVESVIRIMRTLSLPAVVAAVEVAALGGWLPQARPRSRGLLEQGFSSEDLMVLSHGPGSRPQPGELERDEILSEYADALAHKGVLRSSDGTVEREGWDLAMAALSRMDDAPASQKKIAQLLDHIPLTDDAEVDKVLAACSEQGLVGQVRGIAERYADRLAESTQAYGPALVYYARAHATAKLKSTLALLTSICLLHSAAVPTASALDPLLASLLSTERRVLVDLARADGEAAEMLASHLSGYATVRRFYELRDQGVEGAGVTNAALRPLERKREAASALVAVAESAADCIQGGLYDPAVESVIPVDGVLALLGEALPLLGQPKRIYTKEQTFTLLRLVEDYSTAPSRIRENAESLLHASIGAYRNGGGGGGGGGKINMPDLLKKSRSDLSSKSGSGTGLGGSSYDMLASVMAQSWESSETNGGEVVRREWDWRKGLDGFGGAEVGGKEVLTLIRTALAQEVARGWTGQINW